jgi:hypothetical protein
MAYRVRGSTYGTLSLGNFWMSFSVRFWNEDTRQGKRLQPTGRALSQVRRVACGTRNGIVVTAAH